MAKKKRERRKPGTGYATEAPNKTFSAYFPKFGGGHHVRKGFDTRQDAEAWLDSLVEQQKTKGDVRGGQRRTDEWLDTWATRAAKEREWKPKMIADVQWKLGYVKPFIGAMAIADVMPDHVDAIWDDLRKSLAEVTVRQIINYLYQVFEDARARRYITYNPVIKPARRKRAKRKEPTRLNAAQAALLLGAAAPTFYAPAWWVLVTLGLRAGEICGLRWGDLDLDNGIIHIEQAVGDVRGAATKGTPKNDKRRYLALPRGLVALLRLHKQVYTRRASRGQRAQTWEEHQLVFPGRGGRPMNPTSLRHQLKRLTDACKLPPVTTHMLRHTAGKFYTDIGTPQDVKTAILGHTPDITGHYAPPDPEAMRPWVEQVYQRLTGEVEKGAKTG